MENEEGNKNAYDKKSIEKAWQRFCYQTLDYIKENVSFRKRNEMINITPAINVKISLVNVDISRLLINVNIKHNNSITIQK